MTKNLYAANGISDLPDKPGVYLIRNMRTGRCYIGATYRLRTRCRGHFGQIKRGEHPNMKIRHDAAAHGAESFRFIALGIANTARKAYAMETYFRQLLDTADPETGYDLEEQGCYTKESRLRMVEKRLSKSHPPRYCWLDGVNLYDSFSRNFLKTWKPNPPGMKY